MRTGTTRTGRLPALADAAERGEGGHDACGADQLHAQRGLHGGTSLAGYGWGLRLGSRAHARTRLPGLGGAAGGGRSEQLARTLQLALERGLHRVLLAGIRRYGVAWGYRDAANYQASPVVTEGQVVRGPRTLDASEPTDPAYRGRATGTPCRYGRSHGAPRTAVPAGKTTTGPPGGGPVASRALVTGGAGRV